MKKDTNGSTGYWLEEGTHEVTITQVEKQSRPTGLGDECQESWRFTMEDEDWSRVYHSVLCKETTKPVLRSLAAACGVNLTSTGNDADIMSLQGKKLIVKVVEDGGFPRVVRWRRLPEADTESDKAA